MAAALTGLVAGGVGGGVLGAYEFPHGECDNTDSAAVQDVMACLAGMPSCSCHSADAQASCDAQSTCTWAGGACGVNPATRDLANAALTVASDALACGQYTSGKACSADALCAWDASASSCAVAANLCSDQADAGGCIDPMAYLQRVSRVPSVQTYLARVQSQCQTCAGDAACTDAEWGRALGLPVQVDDSIRQVITEACAVLQPAGGASGAGAGAVGQDQIIHNAHMPK